MIKPRPACGRTGLLVSLEAQIWFVQENNISLKLIEIQCSEYARIGIAPPALAKEQELAYFCFSFGNALAASSNARTLNFAPSASNSARR